MEFKDVIRRRRMVRRYEDRPVPPEVRDRLVQAALRAPSAGFSQGWGFLVLDQPDDIARFREASTLPVGAEDYFAAEVQAPLIIVPHSNKDAYMDRYAEPDKGHTDRSDAWWPSPYWDIDTGFAAMLILLAAVDEGLGACFFGIPKDRIEHYKAAFGVPAELHPIGAISIGYPDEPPRDFSHRRRATAEVVRHGRWSNPDQAPRATQ